MVDQFYFIQQEAINDLTDKLNSAKHTVKALSFIIACISMLLIINVI